MSCYGEGEITCETCDGDGTTHKFTAITRAFTPTETSTYVTYGVPERHLQMATGTRASVESLPVDSNTVRHEREIRQIPVLEVVYDYVERGLFAQDSTRWTVYEIEGELRYDDFPKQTVRRFLPIALIALLVLSLILIGVVMFL